MSLKNLKSIFTEGLEKFTTNKVSKLTSMNSRYDNMVGMSTEMITHDKTHSTPALDIEYTWPGPANFLDKNSDYGEGFTLNFTPGIPTQYDIGPQSGNTPVLDQFITIPFVVDIGGPVAVYDTLNYGSNTYKGTQFDNNLGGLFNSNTTSGKYSTTFNTINTPKGYSDSVNGNDIIEMGNITNNGAGYTDKKSLMLTYFSQRGLEPETTYRVGGDETTDFINTDRVYIQDQIPSYNNNLDLAGDQMKSFENNRHRKIKIRGSDVTTESLGQKKNGFAGWSLLYTNDQRPIEDVGYYYPNVNRDNLDIRTPNPNDGLFGSERTVLGGLLGRWSREPFIISELPTGDIGGIGGGRGKNSNIISRAITDEIRIGKFLTTAKGLNFAVNQNLNSTIDLPVISTSAFETGTGGTGTNTFSPAFNPPDGLKSTQIMLQRVPQRFNKFFDSTSILRSIGSNRNFIRNTVGTPGNPPLELVRGDEGLIKLITEFENQEPFHPLDNSPAGLIASLLPGGSNGRTYLESKLNGMRGYLYEQSMTGGAKTDTTTNEDNKTNKAKGDVEKYTKEWQKIHFTGGNVPTLRAGDRTTLSKMLSGENLQEAYKNEEINHEELENHKTGLKMYFKDLRDNTYIFFRGYLDGLNENLNPEWITHNYIGRSEPVYTYNRTERNINFTLTLFAHTYDEFIAIYKKMNRLTSLCYPEYHMDNVGALSGKSRMKPPLTKLVIGDYFGSMDASSSDPYSELSGFLKTLTYTVPDESPWEAGLDDFYNGKGYKRKLQAPKLIKATIDYQVVHGTPPSLQMVKNKAGQGGVDNATFYGVTKHFGGSDSANTDQVHTGASPFGD